MERQVTIESVGIDIGSSTSSLMFSSLTLAKPDSRPESKFEVLDRAITFKSRILLTPFVDRFKIIDTAALAKFLDSAYADAGKDPAKIDTGAVIITGEAATKENSASIVQLLSERAGKFVCAVAGPNLEAVLAAHGSGAVARSVSRIHRHGGTEHRHPIMMMNVDMGGGTTKVAIAYGGRVLHTSSINVGARLVAFDRNSGEVQRIESAARIVAEECGVVGLEYGRRLTEDERRLMSAALADALLSLIDPKRRLSPLARRLMVTSGDAKPPYPEIDAMIISGGVSEFVYHRNRNDYGDLGMLLAEEVRKRILAPDFGIPLEVPDEFIRATAIGASQYSIQLSGNTIYISDEKMLPVRNVPVCSIELAGREDIVPSVVREKLLRALRILDRGTADSGEQQSDLPCAICIRCPMIGYEGTKKLALGLGDALATVFPPDLPVILISRENLGSSLGRILVDDLGARKNVISIDEVDVSELDYVDIGSRIPENGIVPVAVKSLIFKSHVQDASGSTSIARTKFIIHRF